MTRKFILIALMFSFLTACSSIPKERKSDCVCDWRPVNISQTGVAA